MFIVKYLKKTFSGTDNNTSECVSEKKQKMNSDETPTEYDSDNDDLDIVLNRKTKEYELSEKKRKEKEKTQKQIDIDNLHIDQVLIDYFTKNRKEIREKIINQLRANNPHKKTVIIWTIENEKWFYELRTILNSTGYDPVSNKIMKNILLRNQTTLKNIINTTSQTHNILYCYANRHCIVYTDVTDPFV